MAGLAILGFAAAIVTFRTGAFNFGSSFLFIKVAAPMSLAATVLSVIMGSLCLVKSQYESLRFAVGGLILGLALSVPMLRLKNIAESLPRIHDITTDTVNPPQFVNILPQRKEAPNSTIYEGEILAEQQRKAYPEIQPKIFNKPMLEVYQMIVSKAKEQAWDIISADSENLRLEATETSRLFGFKDDVVIRVTLAPEGSRVDMRSVSRVGISDLGKNAERIRKFFAVLAVN